MVLGTSGMTVMDQATGFSVFANGGFAGMRHGIVQISDPSGKILWDFKRDMPEPKRVLSEKAASEMNSMLVQVPERGTARRAALPMTRVAGKTGTTRIIATRGLSAIPAITQRQSGSGMTATRR